MGEPVFLDWYGSDAVRAACAALLHVQPGEMQMEHINFLCNPQKQSFGLLWHRDIIPKSASPEEELAGLKSTDEEDPRNQAFKDLVDTAQQQE
jgi:hypothetical protein